MLQWMQADMLSNVEMGVLPTCTMQHDWPAEVVVHGHDGMQDPVLFSGTIRSNVDPMGETGGDAAVWQALRQAGLGDTVTSLEVCVDGDRWC